MSKTLYYGGTILTLCEGDTYAEALVEEDGRIVAAGALADIEKIQGICRKVDLGGRCLMPSFVDGHSHLQSVGAAFSRCDLTGCTSHAELLERIRRFRQERDLTHGEIITCRGYDQTVMEEGTHPDARLLDTLGFDNPIVCIHQSGHMAGYNTAAMRLCGVDDSFVCPEGGFAARDENGHLTGYFEERARNPLSAVLNKFDPGEYKQAILDAQDYYLSYGITTVQDGSGIGKNGLECYIELARENKLKVDVVLYLWNSPETTDFWKNAVEAVKDLPHLKIGGIKIMLDGSPQARTAWMRKPYEGEESYCAYPNMTDERLEGILTRAVEFGIQPIAHCNGDAACEQFLSGWERVVAKAGHGSELRPVMVHAQTVGYDQLERMAKVGMMPSFFVGHCWFWGDVHIKNFGDRGYRISPMGTALKNGLIVNIHQDSPVTPPDMLHSVWCAVNRITKKGVQLSQNDRLSTFQALKAATFGGAYSYFEEDTKGSLKAGMTADLLILDRDPIAADPMTLKDIKVLEVIKDGQSVYKA